MYTFYYSTNLQQSYQPDATINKTSPASPYLMINQYYSAYLGFIARRMICSSLLSRFLKKIEFLIRDFTSISSSKDRFDVQLKFMSYLVLNSPYTSSLIPTLLFLWLLVDFFDKILLSSYLTSSRRSYQDSESIWVQDLFFIFQLYLVSHSMANQTGFVGFWTTRSQTKGSMKVLTLLMIYQCTSLLCFLGMDELRLRKKLEIIEQLILDYQEYLINIYVILDLTFQIFINFYWIYPNLDFKRPDLNSQFIFNTFKINSDFLIPKKACLLIDSILQILSKIPILEVFTQLYFVNMKSKRAGKTKNKGSLQKTSSTIINIHTHRNSLINETLPLYYNDSMVSIRTSSLLQNKNSEVRNEHKCANFSSQNKLRKKKFLLRDMSQNQQEEKKHLRDNQMKIKKSNFSRQARQIKLQRRSYICSEKKKISKKSLAITQSIFGNQSEKVHQINNFKHIFQKNKAILEHYKHYTEQLEIDRNKYKEKYKEVLLRLRKYEHK